MAAQDILLKGGLISQEMCRTAKLLLARERQKPAMRALENRFLLKNAISSLEEQSPQYSARQTFTANQILFFLVCLSAAMLLSIYQPSAMTFGGFGLLTAFYGCSIVMRTLLIAGYDKRNQVCKMPVALSADALPVYTILVALYKEAEQIPELVEHIQKLIAL